MISVLLPTRKRPENVMRLWKSLDETTSDFSNIEIVLARDDDDDSYDSLIQLPRTRWLTSRRKVMAQYWNDCYEFSQGWIVMQCGDDIVFRTPGWDEIVQEAFAKVNDGIAFVFGDDGTGWDGVYGTHGFVTRRWVDTVGYFLPPYFVSDFTDKWVNEVAQAIGRHIHIPILTEHMHPDVGKGPEDITHQERRARHAAQRPDLLYAELADERLADAAKLRAVMD